LKRFTHILTFKFIFLILFIVPDFYSYAQSELPLACGGDMVRYGVVGNNGSSVFQWEIEGGTIINNYNDSVDIQWNNVAGIKTITVTETNIFGCEGDPYSQTLLVYVPFVDIGLDAEICRGTTHEFVAEASEVTNYLWQDGISTGTTFIASESGDYWVRVTDQYGCTAADTAALIVHELPVVDLGNDTTLCGPDESIVFDVTFAGVSYEWFDNTFAPTYTAYTQSYEQTIWVQVENEYGCVGSDTVIVHFCGEFTVPNAFTPNDDGVNDVWQIDYLFSFPDVTVDIFNRWGDRVYHSDGYTVPWDGKDMKGKDLPMDAYYYIINFNNGEEPKVGNVTIIR